uniref:histidine kinase n=1 Tax=Roseihalotalea indica TaxID=2867963 RepID=A0AA49JK06_9BACT|nr:ATP-binding protein [Tunicatimonas sp. TK19036]
MLRLLRWIFVFLTCPMVWGAVPPEEPPAFVINEFQDFFESDTLQNYLWIVEDSSNLWSIDEAQAAYKQGKYIPYLEYHSTYGYPTPYYSYWGKIRIKNNLPYDTEWLLEISSKNSFVDVYTRQPDSTLTVQHTGYYLPVKERAISSNVGNSVWLKLQSGEEKEIYIKIKRITGFRPRFALLLVAPQYWIHQDITFTDFTTGLIEGALCIVAIFFLFYYSSLKDRAYFYYALFLLSTAIHYLFDYQYFYTDVILGKYIHLKLHMWLLSSVYFVFLVLFVRSFLNIPERFPSLDRLFRLMIGIRLGLLALCLGIITWSFDLALVDKIYATTLNDLEVVLWIIIIIYLVWQPLEKADRYMLLGVSLFITCIGLVLLTFQVPGLHQYWIPYIYNVGLVSQVICLSIALGVRQRSSQVDAMRTIEKQVKARTKEINDQRRQLSTQAKELEKLNRMRSHLLANISHEFRTPLTLIINPLEQLIQSEKLGGATKLKSHFRQMKFHAKSLLQFVDQLLMLSRIETDTFSLHRESANIVDYLRPLLLSFHGLAERQKINYEVQLPSQPISVNADLQKMTMIVNNLLSNAFKFTPEEGTIIISLWAEHSNLWITVQDNGLGIDPQEHDSIFDRFYQSENGQKHNVTGTGIGLSLTREVVNMHRGDIQLESQPEKGSTFTVCLPIVQNTPGVHFYSKAAPSLPEAALVEKKAETSSHTIRILVVEDNPYMRQHLQDCLHDSYEIFTAADGEEGQIIAEEQLPDLVITDLSMPRQDGIQLTQALKKNLLTSHIPIIMLTARVGQEHQIDGWQHGADAYITKPFDVALLRARLKNLLDERARLREYYLHHLVERSQAPTAPPLTPDPFLEKLTAIVEERYPDSSFDVETLSDAMALSSSQLNRKLKALIQYSSNEFIRSYRLRKAAALLLSSNHTVAEIAYMVGFSSPSYFTRKFREHFAHLPSEHKKYAQIKPDAR